MSPAPNSTETDSLAEHDGKLAIELAQSRSVFSAVICEPCQTLPCVRDVGHVDLTILAVL